MIGEFQGLFYFSDCMGYLFIVGRTTKHYNEGL